MKQDNELMRILKVSEIRHLIATTNNGQLFKVLRFGEIEYHYTLDAVPLNKEKTEEIIKLYGEKKN